MGRMMVGMREEMARKDDGEAGRTNGDKGEGERGEMDDARRIYEWRYGKEVGTYKGMDGETK